MSQPRRVLIALCLLLAGLWVAQTATALEVKGRSSTQYSWYNDIVDGSKQAQLAEYLSFTLNGIDSANKLSVQGYGRAAYALKEPADGSSKFDDRLYYLYADYKGFADTVDMRIGRQFVNLSAGSSLVDGVQADFNNLGLVGVTLMGGRDIQFGEKGTLSSHSYAAGMALYLVGLKKTDLDLSYYRAYDYSDVARDMVGMNFRQFLLDSVKLYANTRYDLTAQVFSEVLGGVKYFPMMELMLTAEYFESYPTFDTTSIFSVFAVDKYKEGVLKADYAALAWLDVSAGLIKEQYGKDGDATVYEIGLRVRPSHSFTVGVFYDARSGYGGDLNGIKTYAEYSDLRRLKLAAGIDYDVYQRDTMTGDEIARKYWAATRYNFTKQMSATLRVEDNVNANYSKDMKGRATFDYEF
ncbi:MAG: hypothetical protein AABZ15_14075 [Nitrospirota bacterium]